MGTISDFYGGRRACVIATFTATLIPLLFIFSEHSFLMTLPSSSVLVLLGVMGCLIGGPINIITSAVAVDLVENNNISGRNDLMTVTGFINGSGSIIAALGLVMIGPLQQSYGWKQIWYLLIGCTCLGTILLSPTITRELRRFDDGDDEEEEVDRSTSESVSERVHSNERALLIPSKSEVRSEGYQSLGQSRIEIL